MKRTAAEFALALAACGVIVKWAAEGAWVVAKRRFKR